MKIAVVGLGIAGLSICARLAEAGHDVSGFEQFALLHDRGSSHGDTRIFRMTPGEGDIYVRMAERAAPLWRAWENINGAPLIQWMDGLMAGPPGSAFVRSCVTLSEAYGHPFVRASGRDIEVQTQGALRLPGDWEVCRQQDCGVTFADAARRFLIKRASDLGARLRAECRIGAPIEGQTLIIDSETHSFDAIIVSAGGWSARLLPQFAGMLTPKRRVIGWFKPRAPLQVSPPLICVDNEIGLYGMATPSGSYKIGAHVVGDAVDPDNVDGPSEGDRALLSAQVAAHLPLYEPNPVRMKRCIYTMTLDENFLIAPTDERVLVFSCCSGHGFKYAPVYGDIALDWIEGRDSDELRGFGLKHRFSSATKLGGA